MSITPCVIIKIEFSSHIKESFIFKPMISNNYSAYSIKICVEILRDIFYFPFWWYSRGLFELLIKLKNFLYNKQKSLALLIWIQNIFRPMYGQYDWAGILISFFIRSFQIIFRSLTMLLWVIFCLVVTSLWLVLPPLVIYEIIFQFL